MPTRNSHTRLADWFRKWRSPMRKFLVTRGAVRVADCDDVAQEVFLRLLRYETAEIVEHPQAYLFKMAANVVAEWAIRSHYRLAHEPRWLATLVSEDQAADALDSEAAQQEIKRAIGTLSARQQAILKLHFEEGLSQLQIAERLGLPPRVVRRDVEKSYSKLRRELSVELTGASSHGSE
jgi:RNA polymerase sigma factor (sigma-70 family)